MPNKRSVNIKKGEDTSRPNPNIVEINQQVSEECDFPSDIQEMPGKMSDSVCLEWEPSEPGEYIVGEIIQSTRMNLGGLAYVIRMDNAKGVSIDILLKRGGRVLESKMKVVCAEEGDRVAILYQGEGLAKPGQNAPRLWKLKKIS